MALQENIKYVREKKIASLLNEMVLHILSKQPTDPLDELIQYMDRKNTGTRGNQEEEVAAAPEVFTPAAAALAPIRKQDDKTKDKDKEKKDKEKEKIEKEKAKEKEKEEKRLQQAMAAAHKEKERRDKKDEKNGIKPSTRNVVSIKPEIPRSRAVEEDPHAIKITNEHAFCPLDADKIVAQLTINEIVLKNVLADTIAKAPASAQVQLSQVSSFNKTAMALLGQCSFNNSTTVLYQQMREVELDLREYFTYRCLDLVEKVIKGEVVFNKQLKDWLNYATQERDNVAKEYLRTSIMHSDKVLGSMFSLETNSIDIERHIEGGIAGAGSLHFMQDMGGVIIKRQKLLEQHQSTLSKTLSVAAPTPKVPPLNEILLTFTHMEHKFRSTADHARLHLSGGNKYIVEALNKSIKVSKQLQGLMETAGFNYFCLADGKEPKKHEDVLAALQRTKEDLGHTLTNLRELNNKLTVNVYTKSVTTTSKDLLADAKITHDELAKKTAEFPAIPNLEKAFDMNNSINDLLAQVQRNQLLLQKAASRS